MMLRFATIGSSWITAEFAAAVSRVSRAEVRVAFSRSPERARAFAQQIGAPSSTADLTGLLSSEDVDAVYIASPNSLHRDQAQAAIRAGKHVLVEKPATATAAEFDRLVDEAKAAGVILMEAMRPPYDPGTERVASLLPQLGPLRRASLRFCQRSSRYDQVLAGERVNIFDPAFGGGAFADLGVYCVSVLIRLLGEPSQVLSAMVPLSTGTDGAGAALAVYPGFVADVGWSKITASDVPSEIQGELATLTVDHLTAPRRLELRLVDGTSDVIELDLSTSNMDYEVERFVALCAGEADSSADQALTRSTLRTMDAIRASAVLAE